jgi:hypothetical protein
MHCAGSRDCNGELLEVEVEAVIQRRAATDTQVLHDARQPLLEPSAQEDQAMRAVFTAQLDAPHRKLVVRARRSKTFLDRERDGFTWGWLCVEKPNNRGPLAWPSNQGQLYASPATPYVCFQAGHLKGRGWEVLMDTRSELRPDRRSPIVS